jgi:hypothetical protein
MPSSLEEFDTPQRLRQQRREWRVERAGWIAIGALLVAALAGAFGPGPLTHRTARSVDASLELDYYTIERREAPVELRFRLKSDAAGGAVQLRLPQSLVDVVSIESLTPPPLAIEADDGAVVYSFRHRRAEHLFPIVLRVKYYTYGAKDHQFATDGGSPITIRQWVLP